MESAGDTPEVVRATPDAEATRDDLAFLARGGALNLVGVVASGALGFLLVVIVTRGFDVSAAGIFFVSIGLFHVAVAMAQWGAEVGVVRTIPRYGVLGRIGDLRGLIWSATIPVVVVGVLLGLMLFAFAGPIGGWLTNRAHGEDLRPVLAALAPFLPLAAVYTVALAATRGFGTMVPTTVIDKLGRAGVQPALALLVAATGASTVVLGVAWATPFAVGLVVVALWLAALLRRAEEAGASQPTSPPLSILGEFWRFSGPRGLASVLGISIAWLGTLMLSALRSTAEAGVYAAATRYLVFGQLLGLAIGQVAAPRLSGLLSAEDSERAQGVYATATSWLMVLVWPLYLTLITFGPVLLGVFGGDYRGAGAVLAILGSAMLVATLVGPVDMVLLMAGRSSWNLFNTLAALAANVAVSLALIPRMGVTGAALGWAAAILTNNLLPLAQVWRFVGVHPFGSGTLAASGSALLVFGVVAGILRMGLGADLRALVLLAAIAAPTYPLLVWSLRRRLRLEVMGEAYRWVQGKLGAHRRPRQRPPAV